MGYHIETPLVKFKAEYLIREHGAKKMSGYMPIAEEHEVLVCVVDNGPFEVAGIMYSQAEADSANNPDDPRPKQWLLMTKEEVINLNPAVADVLT